MKTNNVLVLTAGLLAGLCYSAGKKVGKKEMLYKFQRELLKVLLKPKEEEES